MPISKRVFSGSSGGRSVSIGTGLTTIHTAASGVNDFDEVFFYVHNTVTVTRKLTFYVGATLAKDKVVKTIASQDGFTLVGPGMPLGLGKSLKALCTGAAGSLNGSGWVNRIDQ